MKRTILLAVLLLCSSLWAATRTFTTAGVNNLWSNAANWDTGVPVDTDTAVIDAGKTVEFDVDQSGFASGITLTLNGTLQASTTAGAYYLKLQNTDMTIGAAGVLRAGTSVAVPYPSTCTFTIDHSNNAKSIEVANGGHIYLYCTQPTNRYIYTDEASGSWDAMDQIKVATDITADQPWTIAGAQIRIVDSTPLDSEIRTISSLAADEITVSAVVTNAKSTGSLVALVTRNVRIINVAASDYGITFATGAGSDSYIGAEINNCYRGTSGGTRFEFAGTMEILTTSPRFISDPYTATISGVICGPTSGSSSGIYVGESCTISGLLAGCTNGLGTGLSNTVSGKIFGCTVGASNETNITVTSTGVISHSTTTNAQNVSGFIYGTLSNSGASGILYGNKLVFGNATLSSNTTADLNGIISGVAYNTSFGSAVEFLNYNSTKRSISSYLESFDHDQVENAFKAWCKGGVVTSQTASPPDGYGGIWYELAAEDITQTYPVFRQYETTVQPGTAIEVEGQIRIADGENLSAAGLTPQLQIIDKFADPLVDSTQTALDYDEPADCTGATTTWQDVSVIWANQGASPRQVIVRMIAYNDGGADTVYVDTVWAVADYQDQIASIYAKLPTNYIMGSSDVDDHDDEIDDILLDTGTTIPGLIAAIPAAPSAATVADAVWDEAVADHTGETTFGGEVGGLDPNLTLVLADTNELQVDWTDGGRLDLLLDAVKAMTDLMAIVTTTVADTNDANSVTLTAGRAADDAYTMHAIMVEDATDSHAEIRWAETYDSDRDIEFDEPLSFDPEVGDKVWVLGPVYGGFLYQIQRDLEESKIPVYYFDTTGSSHTGAGGTNYYQADGTDPP